MAGAGVVTAMGSISLILAGLATTSGEVKVSTSTPPVTLSPDVGGFLMPSSASLVRAFKRELERVQADDALVADKRELGALREGRVVMATGGKSA